MVCTEMLMLQTLSDKESWDAEIPHHGSQCNASGRVIFYGCQGGWMEKFIPRVL